MVEKGVENYTKAFVGGVQLHLHTNVTTTQLCGVTFFNMVFSTALKAGN